MPSNMLDLKYDVYSAPPYNFDFFNITPNDVETNLNYQYVSPFDTNVYGLPYSWGNFRELDNLDQGYILYQPPEYNFDFFTTTPSDVSTTLDNNLSYDQTYEPTYPWGYFRQYDNQTSPPYLSTLNTDYDSPVNKDVPTNDVPSNKINITKLIGIGVFVMAGIFLVILGYKVVKR